MKNLLSGILDSDISYISIFFIIFSAIAVIFDRFGISPTHDAITWFAGFDYFYKSLSSGTIPYWNPYSQTGTPFYQNFQGLGLLDPSNLIFIILMRIFNLTSFSAYLGRYLFCFFIFIIGCYSCIRIVAKDKKTSFIFSLVMALGCFPVFMRQNGALIQFYLLPFITFCILNFLSTTDVNKQGLFFFIASCLISFSLLIHIPAALILYLICFCVFGIIFKVIKPADIAEFLKTGTGIRWVILSIIASVLITAPIWTLAYDFLAKNEMFPFLRIFQANDGNLPKIFATDLNGGIANPAFCDSNKVSLTLGNLLGFIFEPFHKFIPFSLFTISEIRVYLSIVPLVLIWAAIKNIRGDRFVKLFLAIAVIFIFASCNFMNKIVAKPSLFQQILTDIFPFLGSVDVLENFAIVFVFCFLIIAAIGFKTLSSSKAIIPVFVLSMAILFFKYCYLVFGYFVIGLKSMKTDLLAYILFMLALISGYRKLSLLLLAAILVLDAFFLRLFSLYNSITVLLLISLTLFFRNLTSLVKKALKEKLLPAVLVLLLADLLVFAYCVEYPETKHAVSNDYYNYIRSNDLISRNTDDKQMFAGYRQPYIAVGNTYPFNTFFAPELLKKQSVAFLGLSNRLTEKKKGLLKIDYFFTTKYFYDYFVHVSPVKQLFLSSIATPVINFFPLKNSFVLPDKYAIIKAINNAGIKEIPGFLYIEKDVNVHLTSPEYSDLFNAGLFLKYGNEDLHLFKELKTTRLGSYRDFRYLTRRRNVNELELSCDIPEDGYLYFGNGYSRHWRAFLDRMPVKIEKANINFMAVPVSRGTHTIHFRYDPSLIKAAMYFYFTGFCLFLSVVISSLRRITDAAQDKK